MKIVLNKGFPKLGFGIVVDRTEAVRRKDRLWNPSDEYVNRYGVAGKKWFIWIFTRRKK